MSKAAALPSYVQMRLASYPAAVVEQVHALSMRILQRLLAPLVLRWLSRRSRSRLVKEITSVYGAEAMHASAYQAMLWTSALGTTMPALSGEDLNDGRPPRPAPSPTSADAKDRRASLSSTTLSRSDISPADLAAAQGALHASTDKLKFAVHLQDEHIQSLLEPGHEVVLLLAGSLRRNSPNLAVPVTSPKSLKTSSPKLGASRRGSSASTMSLTSTTMTSRTGKQGMTTSSLAPTMAAALMPLLAIAEPIVSGTVRAPAVLGELACFGGYPFCEELAVETEQVLVARMSRETYCELIAAMPQKVQRALMVQALKRRERLLSFYSPLTLSHLRLSPLLTLLRQEELQHVLEYTTPKVFAAGMQCGERNDPSHIVFIRRGHVRMEHEGHATEDKDLVSAGIRGRTLLVEGHTFGETPCIFHESLGDTFHAVTHVDAYLLPFNVLIQLMKQQPEVQKVIYSSARALSILREKHFDALLFSSLKDSHNAGRRRSLLSGSITSAAFLPSQPIPSQSNTTRRVTIFECTSSAAGDDYSLKGGRVSVGLINAMKTIPLVGIIAGEDVMQELTRYWKCVHYRRGETVVRRGGECNRLLFFYEGKAGVVVGEQSLAHAIAATNDGDDAYFDYPSAGHHIGVWPIPSGHCIGYTCARRHRWAHSVIALDDHVEVWEMPRAALISVLRKHNVDARYQAAVLQVLQPLCYQSARLTVLDYQPLLSPVHSSLWSEQDVPNMHPVTRCENILYPVWREGDFPLSDRMPVTSVSAPATKGAKTAGQQLTPAALQQHAAAAAATHTEPGRRASGIRAEFIRRVSEI